MGSASRIRGRSLQPTLATMPVVDGASPSGLHQTLDPER